MNHHSRYRAAALLAFGLALTAGAFVACAGDDPQAPEDGGQADSAPDARTTADAADAAVADDRAVVLVDATALEVTCEAGPCVVQLAGGGSQICARTATDVAYCWGNNACGEVPLTPADAGKADGEAGAPAFVPGVVPGPREILTGVAFVSVGLNAGCAAMTDGALKCWGGLPTVSTPASCSAPLTPQTIAGLPPIASVTASSTVVCGVSQTKDVWCWGSTPSLLARVTCTDPFCDSSSFPPGRAELVGATKTSNVYAFANGGFAVDETGQLQSWGANAVLGRPTPLAYDTPYPVTGLDRVSAVAPTTQYFGVRTCAVSNGAVFCWGVDYSGAGPAAPTQVALPAGQVATSVSVGAHACATTLDGSVYCWGTNGAGQLGDGSGVDQPIYPVKVQGLKAKAAHVVATDVTSCALLVTGEVECWGGNVTGQLGLGAADHLLHPQPGLVIFP